MGCWVLNPGWLCARQTHYPLYYSPGPDTRINLICTQGIRRIWSMNIFIAVIFVFRDCSRFHKGEMSPSCGDQLSRTLFQNSVFYEKIV